MPSFHGIVHHPAVMGGMSSKCNLTWSKNPLSVGRLKSYLAAVMYKCTPGHRDITVRCGQKCGENLSCWRACYVTF